MHRSTLMQWWRFRFQMTAGLRTLISRGMAKGVRCLLSVRLNAYDLSCTSM